MRYLTILLFLLMSLPAHASEIVGITTGSPGFVNIMMGADVDRAVVRACVGYSQISPAVQFNVGYQLKSYNNINDDISIGLLMTQFKFNQDMKLYSEKDDNEWSNIGIFYSIHSNHIFFEAGLTVGLDKWIGVQPKMALGFIWRFYHE